MGELMVTVDIDVTHQIQSGNNLAKVELCISKQELETPTSVCPEGNIKSFDVCTV